MNLPRYNFSKESEPELLQFFKVATEQKCTNKCDLKAYEVWNKLLPPDPSLLKRIAEYEQINSIPTVDLCADEEIQVPQVVENEEQEVHTDKTAITDVAFVIKENFQTQDTLSNAVKDHLLKCHAAEWNALFELLQQTLSLEELYYLGNEVQNINSEGLMTSFCHSLLVPKIKIEFCDKIVNLLEQLATKYSSILEKECLSVLHELVYDGGKYFLQYIKKMNLIFQSKLVGSFILSLRNLDDNNLMIIGSLLNDQVEYEALNKLVELLSHVAEDHSSDKNFGKLLMKVIEILGPNLVHLEQLLKHIIAGHKSVWKSKLEKSFSTCYEDSMLFTQSFRY